MDVCFWEEVDDGNYYESSCNKKEFQFTDGNPQDNGFEFCPYCGKKLIVKKPIFDEFMNEKTLLGTSCNGTEIYGKLDKIRVHTDSDPHSDGSSWGWLSGCSKFVCWSNHSGSRFTKKDADELANKWNNRRK